jgi:chromosomal replication initiation ATPase DnaA
MTPAERTRSLIGDVAFDYGLVYSDLIGRSRDRHICQARFSAYRALRDLGWSQARIGRAFQRDHTTILHGLRVVKIIDQESQKI